MQNRSLSERIFDEKKFQYDFRASFERYTQTYREDTSLHYHNCVEIGMCTSGTGSEYIDGKLFSFYPDSIVIIQKECIHDSHIMTDEPVPKPSEWVYLFVDFDALGVKNQPNNSYVFSNSDMTALFWAMCHELEEHSADYEEVFRLLLESFIIKANRITKKFLPKGIVITEALLPAIGYISNNFSREITIEDIAASCNISTSHFRKLFKKYMDCSPLEYLNNLRLSNACKMLESKELSVTEIAGMSGFSSISTFNRLFKEHFNVSPTQFRKYLSAGSSEVSYSIEQ